MNKLQEETDNGDGDKKQNDTDLDVHSVITEKIKSSFENMLGSIDKFGDRKFWNMAIYYFCIGTKFFVIIVRIRLTTAWLIR